nr:unnamed protein product [Callosobruchus chinensis]
MYNGIGLATPRGSGTNGHVQRNWALVRPKDSSKAYKSEAELSAMDAATARQPNREILDHERKRKIELKCAEFQEILEEQGFTEDAIVNKVNNYRTMLMGEGAKLDRPVDQWGRPSVTETHQVALAQQEKNARLREAFGISEYFVEGSSLDPARKAKEQLAKEEAERKKREQHRKEMQKEGGRYEMVRTPTPEREAEEAEAAKEGKEEDGGDEGERKKKKRKDRRSIKRRKRRRVAKRIDPANPRTRKNARSKKRTSLLLQNLAVHPKTTTFSVTTTRRGGNPRKRRRNMAKRGGIRHQKALELAP